MVIYPIQGAEVNYTAILNLKGGEVQFNNIRGVLSPDLLTQDILSFYNDSAVKPISNLALNDASIEWASSLLLSIDDISNPDIFDINISWEQKLQQVEGLNYEGILFIDPSDITNYVRINEFFSFLKYLKHFQGEKYLSLNENELSALCDVSKKTPSELTNILQIPIIYHTSSEVVYYGSQFYKFKTKNIQSYKTFVGAGDVFNAAVVYMLLRKQKIDISLNFGIKCASYLIETGYYPELSKIDS